MLPFDVYLRLQLQHTFFGYLSHGSCASQHFKAASTELIILLDE